MAGRLRRDRSPRQLAAAVTLYHVVIEGTLAQPGQHFMETYIEQLDILPGFRAGIRNVALDEQRHIAFGVKLLSDLHAERPQETQDAIVETIREVGPYTSAIAMPPGWDDSYYTAFGFTYDELAIEGTRSLELRLRAIGLDLETIPRFPIAMDLPLEERSRRGRVLLEANLTGPGGPVARDPQAIAAMFDTLRRSAEPAAVPPGTVIEWDFTDHEPWHLTLSNGSTAVAPGRAPRADLRLRLSLSDWADLFAGRQDPRRLLLRRRLRPSGDLRLLLRLPRIFPA